MMNYYSSSSASSTTSEDTSGHCNELNELFIECDVTPTQLPLITQRLSLSYQSTPLYRSSLAFESEPRIFGSPVSSISSSGSRPTSPTFPNSTSFGFESFESNDYEISYVSDSELHCRSISNVPNISDVALHSPSGSNSSYWSYKDFLEFQNSQSLSLSDWPVEEQEREILEQNGIIFPGITEGECIGHGGFGEIWLAESTAYDGTAVTMACKKISLKFYKREGKSLQRAQELLMNEMKAHEMAKHPHVIDVMHIYHVFPQQIEYNQPLTVLIFMDLCDGDLSKALTKPKAVPMPEHIACQWFLQMALAILYLHSIGIAHRDIKPQNILFKRGLIDGTYTFKITDFGLVKIFDEFDVNLQSPAMSTTIVGTEDYMAPEMTDKEEDAEYDTFLTDVYSLGICLLQCLKIMFRSMIENFGKDRMHEIHRRVSDRFSDDVKDLLKGMLMFDPNKRLNISQVIDHRWTKQIEYQEYYDMGPNW